MITSINEFRNICEFWYHGAPDQNISDKKGIHVGTLKAATQALDARIGIPAEGTWGGTREYGKTLLAGKKRIQQLDKELGYYCSTGFNCGNDLPEENYYPTQRQQRAKYSDGTPVPFDVKPKIFKVDIIGPMTNSINSPHGDATANGLIKRQLNKGVAKSGYYYTNIGEDSGSISAVVPDKSFLKIHESREIRKQHFPSYDFAKVSGLNYVYTNWNFPYDLHKYIHDFMIAWDKDNLNKCKKMYIDLIKLNPQLGEIDCKTYDDIFNVVRGAGSKFNFDDIKFFTDLSADSMNHLLAYNQKNRNITNKIASKYGLDSLQWVASPQTMKKLLSEK